MKHLRTAIIAFVILASASISIYVNRFSIFRSNLNTLTRNILPVNIKMESIDLDPEHNRITVNEFKILNPEGFRRTCLIRIPKADITYAQRNKDDILDGLAISDIVLFSPAAYLDRSKAGQTNIHKITEIFSQAQKNKELTPYYKLLAVLSYIFSPAEKTFNLNKIKAAAKKGSELIEIKPLIHIKDGSLIFDDRYMQSKGYKTTLEGIEAKVALSLKEDLKGLDYIESEGSGFINGQKDQALGWVITSSRRPPTMGISSVFSIQNLDLVHFRPYYDKFSPLAFEGGRANGKLDFRFADGKIDSLNELGFTAVDLKIKEDYPLQNLWAVSGEELSKYFISQSGEIFFDFEIYGPADQPKFALGPKTKIALAKMVADKIADVLLGKHGGTQDPSRGEKGLMQKIMDKYKELRAAGEAQSQLEAQESPQAEKPIMQDIVDNYKEFAGTAGEEIRFEGQPSLSQLTNVQEAIRKDNNKLSESDAAKLRQKAEDLQREDNDIMKKIIEKYKRLKESSNLEQ